MSVAIPGVCLGLCAWLTVRLSSREARIAASSCGTSFDAMAPTNLRSIEGVKLRVCDECPSQYCNANHFDLTFAAAKRIMGSDWHDIGLKGGLDYELIDFV